jgi:hypothetical protein
MREVDARADADLKDRSASQRKYTSANFIDRLGVS